MINVTKSFLPDQHLFLNYVNKIWESGHLTNHGPLVVELESKLKEYFGVKHFFFLNNGTIALQIAIKALDLKGEIITTPFSYVATTSSIIWENCTPVFVDINTIDLTIDTTKIEDKITPSTSAILATHVYGIPCNVNEIEKIARKHRLKVIYDAAHSFGVKYDNVGILNFGDISTISFHATKLFHTIEGGGIATNEDDLAHKISYMRNFGHNGPEKFFGVGINGKASEFNGAMGLAIFPSISEIIKAREKISKHYDVGLNSIPQIEKLSIKTNVSYNYAYHPIILKNEELLLKIIKKLNSNHIFPRRYFYPSLNTLNYLLKYDHCPISEDISKRILCLPLYPSLSIEEVDHIINLIYLTTNEN